MKTIEVVAAVIYDDKNDKIFATERGYGEFKGQWEFPGGKIEKSESKEEALKREIREELDTTIEVKNLIDTIEYDYPTFHLIMHCYLCKVIFSFYICSINLKNYSIFSAFQFLCFVHQLMIYEAV